MRFNARQTWGIEFLAGSTRKVTLRCDKIACPRTLDVAEPVAQGVSGTGWSVGVHDLCPDHAYEVAP